MTRMWILLGHYQWPIYCAVCVGVVIQQQYAADLSAAWTGWSAGAVAVIISASVYGQLRHDFGLCERCLDLAPFLGPQTAVERRSRELRLYHRFAR